MEDIKQLLKENNELLKEILSILKFNHQLNQDAKDFIMNVIANQIIK